MKTATEAIFRNEAGRNDTIPDTAEYRACAEEFDRAFDKLAETLSEEQTKLLEELYLCNGAVNSVTNALYFRKGLNLGLRLGFEACSDADIWKD